ncbi:hypothetical protein D3C81_1886400 [compost metagenome]
MALLHQVNQIRFAAAPVSILRQMLMYRDPLRLDPLYLLRQRLRNIITQGRRDFSDMLRCSAAAAADNPAAQIGKHRGHLAKVIRRSTITVLPVHIIGDPRIWVY